MQSEWESCQVIVRGHELLGAEYSWPWYPSDVSGDEQHCLQGNCEYYVNVCSGSGRMNSILCLCRPPWMRASMQASFLVPRLAWSRCVAQFLELDFSMQANKSRLCVAASLIDKQTCRQAQKHCRLPALCHHPNCICDSPGRKKPNCTWSYLAVHYGDACAFSSSFIS